MELSLSELLITLLERPIRAVTRRRARMHLLDWIGTAALGAISNPGRILLRYGQNQPPGPCLALGADFHDATSAVFVNGGLGNIYELNDTHRTSIMHAGDVVIPAALSAAQRENAPGEALLNALIRGYETAIRIGTAVSRSGYAPWYNSSTCGVFGATSAAADIFRLTSQAHADALGQAGMQASGLWQCRLEPGFSKQFASARAAQSGLIAADVAQLGFPGPRFILEGELGFFKAYYPETDNEAVVADPHGEWKIVETSFKPWPACRHTHPTIEAGFNLRKLGRFEEITEISVETYQAAVDFCDNATPKTEHEGQFSLQHCLAVALVKGDIALSDFSPNVLNAPHIVELRQKIDVAATDGFTATFPVRYGAEVTLKFADDRTEHIRIETAKGDPENPLTAAERTAKFHNCLGLAGVTARHAEDVETVIRNLEHEADMRTLSEVLRALSTDVHHYIHNTS